MAVLAWVMTGLALWHFTIFVDDRFWGGIVGAFLGALVGSILFAWLIHGLSVPSREDTTIVTALEAIPGTLIGLAAIYALGVRKERQEEGERRAASAGLQG
jgi:hypothetical protein